MKRIIMIMISVILILLSFLSINKKIIQPLIANNQYEKQMSNLKEDFLNTIQENASKREEKINKIQEEQIVIPLPETEEEITRTFIGKYFHNINIGKYEVSYKMLDEKFKNNYFPTLESFKEYCEEKYTDYKVLEYVKYERRADFILVKIIVKSLANEEIQEKEQINIAEKGNNQYTLSFGIEG